MMRWLRGLWYARLRRIDMEILWPACRDKAISLDYAKAAFYCHTSCDRAWMFLGEREASRIIGELS